MASDGINGRDANGHRMHTSAAQNVLIHLNFGIFISRYIDTVENIIHIELTRVLVCMRL